MNMLPLALRPAAGLPFAAELRATQAALAGALQHARLPFARICHGFWADRPQQRDPARYPLFDIAVTENPQTSPAPGPLRLVRPDGDGLAYERTGHSPGQDMVLIHEGLADGGLLLQWHVNAALYAKDTAEHWFEALAAWARWLGRDAAHADVSPPALLPEEEATLAAWEHGPAVERPALPFHALFERLIDRPGTGQGGRPAVIGADRVLTYRAVEAEANAIAHALRERGAERGTVVGVLTGRSPNLPAALLGVWKAGAVYLPLAADLPAERLAFVAGDAGAALLLALDGVTVPDTLSALPLLRPEDLSADFRTAHAHRPQAATGPEDTAYILYTSGSTGRPKGTPVSHGAYVNMVLGAVETFGLTAEDRTLMFASPSFDVSLSDIGVPLAAGAALCAVPYEVLSAPAQLIAFLAEQRVTVADLTPTYLRLFDGAKLPSLAHPGDRRRGAPCGGRARLRRAAALLQRLRPHREHHHQRHGAAGRGGSGLPARRPTAAQHVGPHSRRGGPPGAAGGGGGDLAGRRQPRPRLPEPAGAGGGGLRRNGRRTALPLRRPRALARRRRVGGAGPHRRSGEAERHPHRTRRDRTGAGRPPGHRAGRGPGAGQGRRCAEPVGLRPPHPRQAGPGRGVLARLAGRTATRGDDPGRADRGGDGAGHSVRQGGPRGSARVDRRPRSAGCSDGAAGPA
ncbi:protein of unknown function (plasmid) [Azospirillum baldaniorum]|uniref:AMP-dependent synthetase/ligase domain-containing protein n=1 Tax=Azospirillum baldaniorum TaxID=1064539 RepID=A0A9P1NR36_9PROT|nr:protein of unknown function [Azospirillum baldaniorum]